MKSFATFRDLLARVLQRRLPLPEGLLDTEELFADRFRLGFRFRDGLRLFRLVLFEVFDA